MLAVKETQVQLDLRELPDIPEVKATSVQQVLLEQQVLRALQVLLEHWDILEALETPDQPVRQAFREIMDIMDLRDRRALLASLAIQEAKD
jgi:hypothetical protein